MGLHADVDVHGPLFDGALRRGVARALEESRNQVGDYGVTHVRRRFRTVLKHPTGHLSSRVDVRHDGDTVRINNGDVIYRFWIEGTGSRNRTTRFKGYWTFRRVTQEVRRAAPGMVRDAVAKVPGVGR